MKIFLTNLTPKIKVTSIMILFILKLSVIHSNAQSIIEPLGLLIQASEDSPTSSLRIKAKASKAFLTLDDNSKDISLSTGAYEQSISFRLKGAGGAPQTFMKIQQQGIYFPYSKLTIGMQEVAGTIRWTGSDFEGYNGTQWMSLTGKPINTTWVTAIQPGVNTYYNNPCKESCPSGWVAAADPYGKVCKSTDGQTGVAVTVGFSGSYPQRAYHNCDGRPLAQCYCIR